MPLTKLLLVGGLDALRKVHIRHENLANLRGSTANALNQAKRLMQRSVRGDLVDRLTNKHAVHGVLLLIESLLKDLNALFLGLAQAGNLTVTRQGLKVLALFRNHLLNVLSVHLPTFAKADDAGLRNLGKLALREGLLDKAHALTKGNALLNRSNLLRSLIVRLRLNLDAFLGGNREHNGNFDVTGLALLHLNLALGVLLLHGTLKVLANGVNLVTVKVLDAAFKQSRLKSRVSKLLVLHRSLGELVSCELGTRLQKTLEGLLRVLFSDR